MLSPESYDKGFYWKEECTLYLLYFGLLFMYLIQCNGNWVYIYHLSPVGIDLVMLLLFCKLLMIMEKSQFQLKTIQT